MKTLKIAKAKLKERLGWSSENLSVPAVM